MNAKSLALITAGFLAIAGLGGCASTGIRVSDAQAQSFGVGVATYADVVGELGQPTNSTLSSDGTRTATYSYSAYQARPETFIPYVGAFVGGADVKQSDVVFTFDKNGILRTVTSSQSNQGIGQNLAAGTPLKRNAPQQ